MMVLRHVTSELVNDPIWGQDIPGGRDIRGRIR